MNRLNGTHEAADHAVRLAEASRQDRELTDALMDATQRMVAAQAALARCLCIADQPIRERVCGILSQAIARSTTVLSNHHKGV